MKVLIADKCGFCFGVKRALEITLNALEISNNIYSYGQLIHNNQVSENLNKKGLIEIDSLDDIKKCNLIIRSHGVSKDVYINAESKNINIIDCTCPYVKKVHKIVDKHYNDGYKIIIIGDKNHPEIIGINGWCENSAIIISNKNDIPSLNTKFKYCVVAQTTLKFSVWNNVIEIINNKLNNVVINNTICSATSERQNSAIELASKVDCMIIIGGFHSSNTKKLYELCKNICKNTYHIEKKSDLVVTNFKKYDIIGMTAGASTPDWIISEIYNYLKLFNK